MVVTRNSKSKVCAFCEHWYDPGNSAISPTNQRNFWKVNTDVKNKCLERNSMQKANATGCNKYSCKLPTY